MSPDKITFDKETYSEALKANLEKVCFDRFSGETHDFADLFYPMKIGEGKIAFQNYSEQMEKARSLSTAANSRESIYNSILFREQIEERGQHLRSKILRNQNESSEAYGFSHPEQTIPNQHDASNTDTLSVVKKDNPTPSLACQLINDLQDKIQKAMQQEARKSKKRATYTDNIPLQASDKTEYDNKPTAKQLSATPGSLFTKSRYVLDLLRDVPEDESKSSLMISNSDTSSRILAIASAGYGKSTLLRRIALYYCNKKRDNNLSTNYSLSVDQKYIPCLILLRNLSDDLSIDKAIADSVTAVFSSWIKRKKSDTPLDAAAIECFIRMHKKDLVLLIDGLDELSDDLRPEFLKALEAYLEENPKIPVIMTSRVAGLSTHGVEDTLRRMKFRGRSIIPLSEADAKSYAQVWIEKTQLPSRHPQLLDALEQILNQRRFRYLREFMSTPLELLIILRQLVSNSLSLNRWQMFRDMLRELFTNHVKEYDKKGQVFEDTMTLLSFLAYKMQLKNAQLLYISKAEIEELLDELGNLSFHSDIIKERRLEDYLSLLDDLAANVGIIEKDTRTDDIVYTFPIRAYQEFLTAHACCHLRLIPELYKPAPEKMVEEHMTDSRWISIINFMLSDLSTNDQEKFDEVATMLFSQITDLGQMKDIVEANLELTLSHTQVLCDKLFSSEQLDNSQKELIISCLTSKSAYAYVYAIQKSYEKSDDTNSYLEATAIASVMWEYRSGRSALEKAILALQSGNPKKSRQGAMIVSILATAHLDEGWCKFWGKLKKEAERDLVVSEELISLLEKNARNDKDVYSIIALSNLWMTRKEGTSSIPALLTADLAEIVIETLNSYSNQIIRALTEKSGINDEILELIYTLGSFPINNDTERLLLHTKADFLTRYFINTTGPLINSLLGWLYDKSKFDPNFDQIAIATACLFLFWSEDEFIQAWGGDICKGMQSEHIRKDLSCKRERNHFALVRESFIRFEKAFAEKEQLNSLNLYSSLTVSPLFSLFRQGKILEAAQYCVKNSLSSNLAFLMRYGKLNGDEITEGVSFNIPDLLAQGLKERHCYALINMALYEAESGRLPEAMELLSRLSPQDWSEITSNFWYPELWQSKKDPEGALVCVMGHIFADLQLDDYEEMLQCAEESYPELIAEITE